MQWGILTLLVLLPLFQGDATTTQVSPTENDIPRQEEISKEFNLNLVLDFNPEFVEESSEEPFEGDSIGNASKKNTENTAPKLDEELQWKSREDAAWGNSMDYNWEYNEDITWESSGQSNEEFSKEATNDSIVGMTMVNTTVRSSMTMVSVVTKEPTSVP